jgi:predicted acylesterase/phospholipase RssA/CRP-like cAMP-binding protein
MSHPDAQLQDILRNYFEVEPDHPLADRLEEVTLAGGEWLFRQGDPGDSLFVVVRGRLQVWDEGQAGPDSRPQRLLGEVVPGESVGEVGLLSGEARSAGIRAIRDSRLIRLGRSAFESLAREHPALVMKLAANIAQLVQKSTSRTAASIRRLSTISLVPLSDSPAAAAFCNELVGLLAGFGKTIELSRSGLAERGAPLDSLSASESIPDRLLPWLHDLEDHHRFVLYRCDPAATPWTRLALRQSDIVLYVAEAGTTPALLEWESALGTDGGCAIARPTLVLLQPADKPIEGTAAWLAARRPDFHLHVRSGEAGDIARVARIISGNAVGLVLAGGAARGIAHLGVYRAMLELGIPIDWVGGVSIGSILGAGIAMDMGLEPALAAARHALVTRKPFSDYTLPIVSLVGGRRMDRVLKEYFTQQIEDLPIPYFCISCTLDDGALNIHESGPVATALRASASMPGIFPPAVVDRRLTVDGSVINNLPVDVMQQKPVGKVIAVDLSSQKTYEVPYASVPSPWAVLRGQLLPFTRRHRVPRLMTTLLKSTELGTLSRVQEQGQRADLLLHPPVRQFGMTEVNAFDEMVELTYQYALAELGRWRDGQD